MRHTLAATRPERLSSDISHLTFARLHRRAFRAAATPLAHCPARRRRRPTEELSIVDMPPPHPPWIWRHCLVGGGPDQESTLLLTGIDGDGRVLHAKRAGLLEMTDPFRGQSSSTCESRAEGESVVAADGVLEEDLKGAVGEVGKQAWRDHDQVIQVRPQPCHASDVRKSAQR